MERELRGEGRDLVLQDSLDVLREITLARLSAAARGDQTGRPRVAVAGLVRGGSSKTRVTT